MIPWMALMRRRAKDFQAPTGWARKRGMIISSHQDAPAAFPDSMRVLDATVTRRAGGAGRIVGPGQRVDVITALKAMTIWPANIGGRNLATA